jgi:NADPH-dependent 2,4-dienoyl-CoA reductase/sulfur reductase-like enzyme
MKKIFFNGIVWPINTFEAIELKKALQKFGIVQIDIDEITVADEAPDASFKPIWIYVSPVEDDPYFLASLEGKIDLSEAESDAEISDELMDAIRKHGVCTELVGYYPRADRYGCPGYVADTMKGEALAALHGFVVTNEQFVATGHDRGDDGGEQMWFKVMVPIEKLNAELPELD